MFRPGRPIVPLQNGRRRLETPGPKDGCGGPCSQRRPYHRKWALRLEDPKRQRMAEKSSLRGEAKMHPPQASEKRREFDLPEVSFVVNIKSVIRGGGRSPAEPVSAGRIPGLTGKITGNSRHFGLCSDFRPLSCSQFQRVKAKFPSRRKRELFAPNREAGLC